MVTIMTPGDSIYEWHYLRGGYIAMLLCGFIPGQSWSEPPRGLDIALQTAEGKTLRLSDFRGKIVLVNFWWCSSFPVMGYLYS